MHRLYTHRTTAARGFFISKQATEHRPAPSPSAEVAGGRSPGRAALAGAAGTGKPSSLPIVFLNASANKGERKHQGLAGGQQPARGSGQGKHAPPAPPQPRGPGPGGRGPSVPSAAGSSQPLRASPGRGSRGKLLAPQSIVPLGTKPARSLGGGKIKAVSSRTGVVGL